MTTRKKAAATGGEQIFVASQSGSADVDGETMVFVRGVTRVREGHALLAAVPDYFVPVDEEIHYDVERATAAPGEKRGEE